MATSPALLVILLLAVSNAKVIINGNPVDLNNFVIDEEGNLIPGDESESSYEPLYLSTSDDSEEEENDATEDDSEDDDADWSSLFANDQETEVSEKPRPQPHYQQQGSGGSTSWSQGGGLTVNTHDYDNVVTVQGKDVFATFNDMPNANICRMNGKMVVNSDTMQLYSDNPKTLVQVKEGQCTMNQYSGGKRTVSFTMSTQDCANVMDNIKPMTSTGGVYHM